MSFDNAKKSFAFVRDEWRKKAAFKNKIGRQDGDGLNRTILGIVCSAVSWCLSSLCSSSVPL